MQKKEKDKKKSKKIKKSFDTRLYGKKSKKNKRSLVSLYTVLLVRFYAVLHSALRFHLTFAAQIGNDSGKAGELSITFRPTGKQVW